jgi:hypothetical protein
MTSKPANFERELAPLSAAVTTLRDLGKNLELGQPASQSDTPRNENSVQGWLGPHCPVASGEDTNVQQPVKFREALTALLNRYSKENGSNTPDYLLANFLIGCMDAFDLTVRRRDEWRGTEAKIQPTTGL